MSSPRSGELSDSQIPGPGNASTHSSNSGGDATVSTKYKSIDKLTEEPKKPKSDSEDATENSDFAEPPKYKSVGTLERNKNMKVCHYVSGTENKVPPIIFATDTYQQRKNTQKKNQVYKLQAFRFLEVGIRRILFHIGKTVEEHGTLFTVTPILLAAITISVSIFCSDKLAIKVPFGSFVTSPDPSISTQKSVIGLRSMVNSATNFNSSNPVFDSIRRSSQAEFAFIISPRSNYDSVLDKSILSLYSAAVEQAKMLLPETNKWLSICRENCVDADFGARLLHDKEMNYKYPEASLTPQAVSKYNMTKYYIGNLIGGCELDSDNMIQRAESIISRIKLKDNLNDRLYEQYEQALRNMINNISTSFLGEEVDMMLWSARQFASDIVTAFTAIHAQLIMSTFLLFTFCIVICIKCDAYSSRPFIGLQMAFIIILSVITGYSIVSLNEFNSAAFPAIFIVAAIGVLFFYSYQATWSRYSMTALHPIEKIAFIASWDGPCMIMTLMALIFACVVTSVICSNTYVAHVLLVTGAGFTALLAFALLYMTACLYRSGKREAEGVKWFHFCKDGDKTFTNKFVPDFDEITSGILHEKLTDLKPHFIRKLGGILAMSSFRTGCAFFLACYLMFAVWGLWNFNVNLREEDFVSKTSPSNVFLDQYRQSFPNSDNYLEITFEEPLDYYDNQRRGEILQMLKWAMTQRYANRAISWLSDFEKFQQQSIFDINPETIVPVVGYVFLTSEAYKKYSSDIIFDKFQTQIVKSRMYLELNQKGINERRQLVNGLMEHARNNGLPMSIKAPFLPSLQHDIQVLPTMIMAYGVITGVITIACLVLFSNPALAICQLSGSIIANMAVIAGAVHLGVQLNIVTMVTALLGNFLITSIIILYAYSYCNAGPRQITPSLKAQYAFQCTFLPTVYACLLPLVTFSPLLLLKVSILLHIYKIFALIAAATLITFIFFLPTLMILFASAMNLCCVSMNKICDETECAIAEQSAESIFFIPSTLTGTKAVGYGNHTINSQRMIMAPQNHVDSATASRIKRKNDHYTAHYDYSDNNCDSKSIDSRKCERTKVSGVSSRHQTPRSDRRTMNRRRGSDATEEQIYEEPESPTPMGRPALPIRDFQKTHPMIVNSNYPSYHRGLPRDEYFRYDRDMEASGWRPYLANNHRYPPPSTQFYPGPSPLRSRRYI
uniref:SSD domain-containing protein n=1 Tax=Panagrolaimus sp. JU765 TaxID=591449 RepID=A0AC34QW91_9BILA